MIFYTADLHLGHENILRLCDRPFKDVHEMNEKITANWNSVVTSRDEVYIVGDVLFKSAPELIALLEGLNGTKHLIVGNHDKKGLKNESFCSQFETISEYKRIIDNGRRVVLCHYPIVEWDGFFRGAFHVYGHIHNSSNIANKIMAEIKNAFNAGVDVNGFFPKTLNQLIAENEERNSDI